MYDFSRGRWDKHTLTGRPKSTDLIPHLENKVYPVSYREEVLKPFSYLSRETRSEKSPPLQC